MIKGHRKSLIPIYLFIFLLVTLFINFFHTEKTLAENDNCPACNFLHSSLTTNQINFFHLPSPSLLSLFKTIESFDYEYILLLDPSSRSPPQI